MRRKPRTPEYWPRMKVRGRRNRAKLAARHERVLVIPHARATRNPDGSVTFDVLPAPAPGAVLLRFTATYDGFGRRIA